jgi:hypothetical protein
LSKKELKRYKVIRQWIEGYITGKQAAELLSLSLRQVYRLKKRVLEEDENGVIHKNRGRKPAHALSEDSSGSPFFIHPLRCAGLPCLSFVSCSGFTPSASENKFPCGRSADSSNLFTMSPSSRDLTIPALLRYSGRPRLLFTSVHSAKVSATVRSSHLLANFAVLTAAIGDLCSLFLDARPR